MEALIDYDVMRVVWWLLLGVLLIGLAVMDGTNYGVCALLPFLGKSDAERRIMLNTVEPFWEGSQVWLILGGGAVFAAWPAIYATSFSGFYLAIFVVLASLILRPCAFKYRNKRDDAKWRKSWDWGLFIAGFVPALIFGVAVGNVLQGVPFRFDDTMRSFYEGNFFGLLNPFAILCGLVSVSMLVAHAGFYLALKADEPVASRGKLVGSLAAILTMVLFALGGVWVAFGVEGYVITSELVANGPSNPLGKEVAIASGAWMQNYSAYPFFLIAPAAGFAGSILAILLVRMGKTLLAYISSGLSLFGIISTVGVSMFPFLMPSSIDPVSSLTVWDASSSHTTLIIMLVSTVVFLPMVLAYTSWVFWVMRGTVTEEEVNKHASPASGY
ncbi:MAG: cytochrome d ubiquinol oxidase subunit II [Alphaproteobacteria bacterium]|nr:cytochrome d ubiquinol oxidase subunit II [Alphaproteobacteria bacterium SS10]